MWFKIKGSTCWHTESHNCPKMLHSISPEKQSFLNLFRWDVFARSPSESSTCFLWFSFVWWVEAIFKWKMLQDWTSVPSLATGDDKGKLGPSNHQISFSMYKMFKFWTVIT